MNCVRCGDTKHWHCKADGSNVRNAACSEFLEKWPDEVVPPPVAVIIPEVSLPSFDEDK